MERVYLTMKIEGMIIIVLMCGFLLLIMALKAKSKLLLNLLFRGLVGAVCIILANYGFEFYHIPLQIGLNPLTLLTCIILGFPGLILVFAVNFYLYL